MRVNIDPELSDRTSFYRLLTATVVPRPIAWVSTSSADGTDNLAPHSFFTIASVTPPVVQFTSVGRKDSLRNVEETGEFVVNLAPEGLFEQINATATDFPRGVSEFD
ncbi:flavin reductase family protein, partial [Streptomyces massasporeus]